LLFVSLSTQSGNFWIHPSIGFFAVVAGAAAYIAFLHEFLSLRTQMRARY